MSVVDQATDADDIDFQDADDLAYFDPEVAARELLNYAVDCAASDVFLIDEPSYVAVRLRRLGRIESVQRLSREAGRRLQNHFRAVGNADVTDQIKPTEGRDVVRLSDDRLIDIRISALPSIFGQDLALRLFGGDESIMNIDALGMLLGERRRVRDMLAATSGLILVAGPTGSGKSNSLYAYLKYLRREDRKIHTIEEPIEHLMTGIVQSQVNPRGGVDFAQLLAAILRHAPDVIMIGEIRDRQTAEIAVQASNSGHLVLSTVHARDSIGAIESMSAFGVNPVFLASSLLGVVAQRLVRRLCPRCRFAMDVSDTDDYLSDVRGQVPPSMSLSMYMPVGCEYCSGGYDRLTCIPEILQMTPSIAEKIHQGAAILDVARCAAENGMVPFKTAAQLRVAMGTTTIEEATRQLPPERFGDST
ncbi:MAG: ATPase, T2SS/T4P/T4SS family [Planctomycetota bacterium]